MAKKVKMPGRIESASPDGIVTGAAEIFDDGKGKKQNVINTEVYAELLRLENEKQDNLTIDNVPTENSGNPISSGAVFTVKKSLNDAVSDQDTVNREVSGELGRLNDTKQDNLNFDNAPTEDSQNPVTSGGVYTAEKALSDAIEAILILIPSAATALNQLADKNFVESSLSTATATFRGTYNVVSDLGLAYNATHEQIAAKLGQVISTADNNDYCFVQVPESDTSTDIKHTERYKFNGSVWGYEYDLNNSGFTADQWAAINSNITAVLVAKLTQLPTAEVLAALLAGKQDNLTFDNRPTAGSDNPVKSGGVYESENEIIALINALEVEKQDKLTFDSTPTNGSSNPVTSGGVYEAIYLVQVALASLDNRVISAEHSISVLTENVGILRSLYQALTLSDIIVGYLPTTGVANTVYRVPGVSTYADWMYYNGAWVKLAEYTTLDGYLYKGIATPSGSPAASAVKMFYFALTAGTYTNFGGLVCTEGINILKYDGANWTKEQITYTDGGVFDISAYHATGGTLAKYADLAAALDSNNGGGVPQSLQKGGMSIKYVRTYDNKYIQARCMAQNFTTDVTQWQEVDEKPSNGSKNLVESGGIDNADVSIIKQLSTEITSYTSANYAIQANGNFGTGDVYKHGVIAVNEGDTYIIENYDASADTVRYAFVTTDAVTAGGAVPVVSGTGINIVKHGTSALVTIPAGCSHLIWNAPTRFKSRIYTPYDYIKLSDFPELLDNHPVKGNGIIQTIWNYVNENIGKRIEAVAKTGFIIANGESNRNGKGFVFSVSEGDTVVLSPSSNNSYYAFLTSCIFKYPLVSGTSRVEVTADTTFTIPAGCSYLWVAESYQSYNYKPTKLLINGEDALTNKIDNIPVIYGNQFITSANAVNLSDVLSAVPLNFRKPLSLLLWRDSQQKLQINILNSQQPQNASIWGNENNWFSLITDNNIEQYLYTYPLQFNKDVVNYIPLRVKEYITLSNDGDSFEADVTVGNKDLVNGGYGFSSSLESHGVGIGLAYEKTCVRADDGTWLLSTSQYAPYKARYTFKIEYTNGNILFYVDNVLVYTYTGQKTVTLTRIGNGNNSYGNWNGIIHSLKVNGQRYAIEKSPRTKFDLLPKEDFSNLYIEKTADTFVIYKQLSDNLYVAYPLIHAVKAFTENEYPSFYNNWGLREPKLYYFNGITMTELLTLFRDGEAETAVEAASGISTDKVYVSGSTHGFEMIKESVVDDNTVRHIAMIVDNMTIGETDVISLRPANYVEVKQYSQLYQAYTNTNPFADVVKNWIFGDKVNIKTKVSFTRDIAVNKLMQGMFCVYRRVGGSTSNPYLTNKAFKDNTPYIVYNVVDGWEDNPVNEPLHTNDPDCSKISEYGELGLGFALAISDDNRNSHGGMFVSTNDGYYNKIYFASHRGSEIITAGTEYHATQEWTMFM